MNSSLTNRAKERLFSSIAIDLRALALFRVSLACLLIVNLAQRAFDLRAHLTDAGVLPREDLFWFRVGTLDPFSLHSLSGDAPWQVALCLTSVAAAISLALGFQTRLATGISWALLFSMQTRNPLVVAGGDIAMRLLLFWSMFLPLGERFSLDARALGTRPDSNRPAAPAREVASVASATLLLQVAIIYPIAALFKLAEPSWRNLEAFGRAMQVDGVATGLGQALAALPLVPEVLTAGALAFEGLAVFVFFGPWSSSRWRAFGAISFMAFHLLGIATCFRLGLFPFVMAVGWIPFLPGPFWDALERRFGRTGRSGADMPGVRRVSASAITQFIVGVLGVSVLWHNAATLGWVPGDERGPTGFLRTFHDVTGLDQKWSLWSDAPSNRYFVISAQTRSGRSIDLRRSGQALDWTQPTLRSRDARWWKLELSLSKPDFAPLRTGYGCYWLRAWNRDRDEQESVGAAEGWMLVGSRESVQNEVAERLFLWRVRITANGKCEADRPSIESRTLD